MERKFCIQCGREILDSKHGSVYCRKHGYQIEKYGKLLDANPRTKFDPNEFRFIGNDLVEFDTYNSPSYNVDKTYIIDAEDYPIVSRYKWVSDSRGYAKCVNSEMYLHRILLNAKPGQQVDHINLNVLDNRKENLRICNNGLNSTNRRPYNRLSIKGVEAHRNGKFSAYFRRDGKQYHSPCYSSKEEAAFARFILEQLFGGHYLTQFSSEYINTLSTEHKKSIIQGIKSKFNIE